MKIFDFAELASSARRRCLEGAGLAAQEAPDAFGQAIVGVDGI